MLILKHAVFVVSMVFLASLNAQMLQAGPRHPFHVTIAEAEYNEKSKSLEVALKVFPNDLEEALSRYTGKRFKLEKHADLETLLKKYLREVFVVQLPGGKQVKLKWIGHELKIRQAWLYFEVPLPEGPENVKFANRFHFNAFADQANRLTIKWKKKINSLHFTRAQSVHVFKMDKQYAEPKLKHHHHH